MSGHTPGPWAWFGNTKTKEIYLATVHGGRKFVLQFRRWGMAGAQPAFQGREEKKGVMVLASELVRYEVPYREDVAEILHPDAALIARAPDLLSENEALKARLAKIADFLEGCGHAEGCPMHLDSDEDEPGPCNCGRSLIAIARGEAPSPSPCRCDPSAPREAGCEVPHE